MNQAEIRSMVLGMISTNCYIIMHKETKQALIVDPADRLDVISQMVTLMQAKPCAVLLTHGHFDHMSEAGAVKKKYDIPIYAHEAEERLLADPGLNLSGNWAQPVALKADVLLKDGQELFLAGFSIKVLHTPGHTPGGCCYYIADEKVLFSGDTLFYCSVGRTDFPGSSSRQMQESLNRLLTELPEDTDVLPGHGDCTTIGFEKRNNPYA